MLKHIVLFVTLLSPLILSGQIGGTRSYEFLHLPVNAKMAALGGVSVSQVSSESNQWLANPASLDSAAVGTASIGYMSYFAGTSYSNFSFVTNHKRVGNIGIGVQYLSHGSFESFDPSGASLGTFDASDYAVTVGSSHQLGPFIMGANLKFAGSAIGSFRSSAVLLDIGGIFYPTPSSLFSIGMAFRNIGFVLSEYSETSDSKLPFDVQLGATFRPKYMPVRFTVTAYNLTRDDVVYFDQQLSSQLTQPSKTEQLFRRLNFGAEFLLSKNLHFQAGYNHLVRKELRQTQISGGAGFSYGLLLTVKRVTINYSRAFYHVAGASNFISLNTNIHYFKKSK
jgi:hypothetical protein